MKLHLFDLHKLDVPLKLKDELTFTREEFRNDDLIAISKIEFNGTLTKLDKDQFLVSLKASGSLKMRCAVTLETLVLPLELEIGEIFALEPELEDDSYPIIDNEIDIRELLFENVLLSIPMKVVKPGFEDYYGDKGERKVNENFASLKDFLKDNNGGEE
ncbi:MAG: YceD family protein [Erysipelotrichales bacterium]|nr:YceD family protein [Erysipelotrichales bacterium]